MHKNILETLSETKQIISLYINFLEDPWGDDFFYYKEEVESYESGDYIIPYRILPSWIAQEDITDLINSQLGAITHNSDVFVRLNSRIQKEIYCLYLERCVNLVDYNAFVKSYLLFINKVSVIVNTLSIAVYDTEGVKQEIMTAIETGRLVVEWIDSIKEKCNSPIHFFYDGDQKGL